MKVTVQNWVGDFWDWVVLRSVDTALVVHTWVYCYLLCRRCEHDASHARQDCGQALTRVADTIARALKAKRPKTRYAAGQYARRLMFLRRLLSARMVDWLITRVLA